MAKQMYNYIITRNLSSLYNFFKVVTGKKINLSISDNLKLKADRVILPGVGDFSIVKTS